MTIKQQGGVFGRNPTFHSVETDGGDVLLDNSTGTSPLLWDADQATLFIGPQSGSAKNGNTRLRLQNTNAAYMELVSTTTAATGVLMGDTDDSFRGGIVYDNNVDELRLWAGNASRVVVNSTGNLVMNSGNGIDFSATAGTGTSELFDDYEEGTWTPTYTTDGTDFDSVNYDSRTHGRYVKIGSLVYVSCLVQTDGITVGSASGDVLIGGLPFTVSNDPSNAEGNTGAVSSAAFAGDHPSVGFALRNSTTIKLQYRATANGAVSDLQIADLNTGANDNFLQLALSYRA